MKKKIGFIIHTLSGGGAERVVCNLINGIPNNEYEKYVIVDRRLDLEYECSSNVYCLNISSKRTLPYKLWNNMKRVYKIKKMKKDLQLDICISFLDNPNIMNLITKSNEKTIISVRNCMSEESPIYIPIIRKLIGKLYNKADRVIAISEGVKLDLIENFSVNPDKIEVIYNPIDIDKINKLKNEEIEEKYSNIFKNPTIINAGRLVHQKGQCYLINSFKKAHEVYPNLQLIILGEGELEIELKKQIKDLELQNNIHLLGFQSNLFKYIKNSDIFVFTSLFEGFGNVIVESFACGTPVISTDCKYGPREILAPGTSLNQSISHAEYGQYGVLVPNFNKNILNKNSELILAEAIIELLKNKDKMDNYQKLAKERLDSFDYSNIVNKWLNL